MKLNRILSIFLSLMLILSAVTVPALAEDLSEEAVIYGAESIGILSALGIAEIPAEELSVNITRADFLKMMALAAGYGGIKASEPVFNDMSVDDEREPYLRALYNLGIIAPDANGNINPDTEIGLAEAAAVAVKITGYSLMAESRGGYPSGYFIVAQSKDILKGLPSSSYTIVTKGMAAKLTENTLLADLMVQTGFGSGSSYEESEGQNLLWAVYRVSLVEDVLEGVDLSRIMGENDVETFYAEIGGLELETRKVENIYSYLGYAVKAYYSLERGDIPRLVWIEKSDRNNETVIDIDDISSVSSTRITTYDDENKEKNYNLKRGLPVIYNGVSTGQSFGEGLIADKSGKVRLLDNTGDNACDIIFVDAYETIIVAQVDSGENIIYDKYNIGRKIELDNTQDDPYTVIYDEEGEEVNAGKIEEGSVLAVFASASDAYQGYINVYIVNKTVTGIIEKTRNSGRQLYIDGVEYEVKDACRTRFSHLLKPGQAVSLKLDYDGKAVWAEKAEDLEYQYGFIAAAEFGNGLGGNVKIKMYTLNDVFEIFSGAKTVLIDGYPYKGDDTGIVTKLSEASSAMFPGADSTITASMVRYRLNADGEITAIDTVLNNKTGMMAVREDEITDADDSMFTSKLEDATYRSTNKTLGPKNAFTDTSVVFFYPNPVAAAGTEADNVNDEENYLIGYAKDILVHQQVYSGYTFFSDPSMYNTQFIGLPISEASAENIAESNKFSVVDEVFQMYDETTGEILDCVKFYTSNGLKEVPVKSGKSNCVSAIDNEEEGMMATGMPVKNLKRGDVVAYTIDINGYLTSVRLYFRIDGKIQGTTAGASTNWWSSRTQRFGLIYDKYDGGMLVYFVNTVQELEDAKNALTAGTITAEECELVTNTGASTVYYSYEEGREGEMIVRSSSQSDLKSYKDTGEDCSMVYMQQNYGTPMAVVSFE